MGLRWWLVVGWFVGCAAVGGGLRGAWAQAPSKVQSWVTSADRRALLAGQEGIRLSAGQELGQGEERGREQGQPVIVVDEGAKFQSVDGFGFALTGGSAQLLMRMHPATRATLLRELFGLRTGGIGVSYLRVSIGASDMNDHVYTYDDLPPGAEDPELRRFSLRPDEREVIPVLRQILGIAPGLRILASPWTAPSWMKTSGKAKGGSLKPEMYGVYAQYLVRYLQAMGAAGVPIDALTLQNEPLNENNTPSMHVTAAEEGRLIRNYVGPALRRAGLKTKLVLYDHNCDVPEYPLAILKDPQTAQYVDGSGFHLYGGEIGAMSRVHDAFPAKQLYFTEQMIVQPETNEPLRIAEAEARVVIGAMRNWSRTVLLWNLAADPADGPHTPDGGCPICQGAITLDGDVVTRNLAYYTVAQASKFVRPGSVRLGSTPLEGSLPNVAFRAPDGELVLLVANVGKEASSFRVRAGETEFAGTLAAGSVATYAWQEAR